MTRSLVLLVALACYQPPTTVAPERAPMKVAASFDKTWNAVVDVFADRNIPIRTIDRSSGFIATEPLGVSEDEGPDWADCGSGEGGEVSPVRAIYNVRVRGDSSATTVRVTVRWSSAERECVTRGVWEGDAERNIAARAEGRPYTPAASAIDSIPWVASRGTMAYFPSSCARALAIPRYNRVYFKTEAEAQRAGYQRGRGC